MLLLADTLRILGLLTVPPGIGINIIGKQLRLLSVGQHYYQRYGLDHLDEIDECGKCVLSNRA